MDLKFVTRLPAGASPFAGPLLVKFLTVWMLWRDWGVLDAVRKYVEFNRPGYGMEDLMVVGAALFCDASNPKSIRRFLEDCRHQGLDTVLAGIAERERLPTQSSASRMLGCAEDEQREAFVTKVMPLVSAQFPALAAALANYRDAHGRRWWILDLDGVVRAFRQRGLPEGDGLPLPKRRAKGRPGYRGRKRGETQASRHRGQIRGSSLWLGQRTVEGNTNMADAAADVVRWLLEGLACLGIKPSEVIVRMDGAGGNIPCIRTILEAGMHVLARSVRYELIHRCAPQLQHACWYPVEDSLSGPKRLAAELCRQTIEDMELRTVASAIRPVKRKKHGPGEMVGKTQVELIVTSLGADSFPVEELVAIYFNRAAAENDYARLDASFGVTHTFSNNPAGQDLMELIAMLVWNTQVVAGALMAAEQLGEVPPQQPRAERIGQVLDEPALHALAKPLEPPTPRADPEERHAAAPEQARRDLTCLSEAQQDAVRTQLQKHPGFRFEAAVVCPNDVQLYVHDVVQKADGQGQLVMRALRSQCNGCPKRPGCTRSRASTYAKEIWLTVPGLPLLSETPQALPPPTPRRDKDRTMLPPAALEPGPLMVAWPALRPAELRHFFEEECMKQRIHIQLEGEPPPRQRRNRFIAATAAERQNRRLTSEQRRARNALPASVTVKIRCKINGLLHALLPGAAAEAA